LFSFPSHSPVSPNPNPLHYDEEEAPRSPPTPTHCTTTKKKHPPHQSSTSIPHHSTTGSASFNHRTHDVDPPTAKATEPPISTDQDQSTGKKGTTEPPKKKRHKTTKTFRRVKDLVGPGGIHLQLHWRRPIHRTSPIVDPWKIGAHR
jgi:hypothetical protein